VVAVDAGMSSDGSDLFEGLKCLGEHVTGLKAILLTHWHNDHAAGACKAREASGASVYYHRNEESFFLRQTARAGLRGWFGEKVPEWGLFVLLKGLLGEAPPLSVSATTTVSEGDEVMRDFVTIETPGHTKGHLSYYHRPAKVLFSGDALAVINGRIRFMARPVTLDLEAARQSMRKLLALDIAIVCAGHREPLTAEVPERCAEMLRRLDRDPSWPFLG